MSTGRGVQGLAAVKLAAYTSNTSNTRGVCCLLSTGSRGVQGPAKPLCLLSTGLCCLLAEACRDCMLAYADAAVKLAGYTSNTSIERLHTSAYVSIRRAYVSIRQHTSAYFSIRQHTYNPIHQIQGAVCCQLLQRRAGTSSSEACRD